MAPGRLQQYILHTVQLLDAILSSGSAARAASHSRSAPVHACGSALPMLADCNTVCRAWHAHKHFSACSRTTPQAV